MLACVCQPAETSLYKGGPPTELGPLGSNPRRHQRPRTLKSRTLSSSQLSTDDSKSSSDTSSTPVQRKSPKNLLNLRKIEEKAKSTKILVNPICCDTSTSSDENYEPRNNDSKNNADVPERTNAEDVAKPNNSIIVKERNGKLINCVVENETTAKRPNVEQNPKADTLIANCDKSRDYKVMFIRDQIKSNKTVSSEQQTKDCAFADQLPEGGVGLTLSELRAMALRQQHQIDTQHQLLAAKEQRLRYLKQQEAKHHQVAAEGERLRRLRERVEAQELKLRKLRALRGHVDKNKLTNVTLTSDLESIRALFNEKEKELSVAVAKVEELTRQLEELRRGRGNAPQPQPPPANHHELDKLRRELMYRNKLNEQQNARLSQQRCALGARQDEMRSIDRRIAELQARLLRKRALNSQLARQRAHQPHQQQQQQQQQLQQLQQQQQHQRLTNPAGLQLNNYNSSNTNVPNKTQATRGNIAAVEPYNHIPHAQSVQNHVQNFQAIKQNNNATQGLKHFGQNDPLQNHLSTQEAHFLQQKQIQMQNYAPLLQGDGLYQQQPNPAKAMDLNYQNQVPQGITNHYIHQSDQKVILDHIGKYNIDLQKPQLVQPAKQQKTNEQEFLPEFAASKSDPKYQTLPYNTKFTLNGKTKAEETQKSDAEAKAGSGATAPTNSGISHMTVHSTPLSVINKSLATPLSQGDVYHNDASAKNGQEGKENAGYTQPVNGRVEPMKLNGIVQNKMQVNALGRMDNLIRGVSTVGSTSSTSSLASSSASHTKPISSVAPNTIQTSAGKPSPIYQTSSTKIQPVQPQTVSHNLLQPQTNAASAPSQSQNQALRQTASGLPPASLANHSNYIANGHQNSSSQSLLLSPPQSASTPFATPDVFTDKSTPKPALPPKPPVKTPPRQSVNSDQPPQQEQYKELPPVPSTDPPDFDGQRDPSNENQQMFIKARPLTIRKQPLAEQPKLRTLSNGSNKPVNVGINRRIEMPPAFLFPEMSQLPDGSQEPKPSDKTNGAKSPSSDELDKACSPHSAAEEIGDKQTITDIADQINSVDLNNANVPPFSDAHLRRSKKGNLKQSGKVKLSRRVSFDPLALLLDASLEGELELVKKTATKVQNASAANDEGITALHNAICAGHFDIVKFLVEFGCDVNAQDSDGWTPLHCAASCNNVAMVRFLVENGACIFATTLSDHETAAEKCEEDEEGFDGCSEYLYSVQEKLGIMNGGVVFSVFGYTAQRSDELSFVDGDKLAVIRKGDDNEREWWWSKKCSSSDGQTADEGYVPRNLLGLYPRVSIQEEANEYTP